MSYVTAAVIKALREKRGLTQRELAERIGVSDKAVSKWETARGLPDVGVLDGLAQALGVSIAELLTGDPQENRNRAGNLKKLNFYVCPLCGNVITAVGEGAFSCCGIALPRLEAEPCDGEHALCVETVDHEHYVTLPGHPMTKAHSISFVAYVTCDSVELVKLYPEQDVSVRFRKKGPGVLYAFCNRHGLFSVRV